MRRAFCSLVALSALTATVLSSATAKARDIADPTLPTQALEVDVSSHPPATAVPGQAFEIDLSDYRPGTIVVKTAERRLYLVLANGESLSYPVGVGKAGKTWTGAGYIRGKFLRPAWSPPAEIRRERPRTPLYIPGGSSRNPMGAAAMTLSVDEYAIHGTNDPGSIGGFVSFGCIRMHNRDVLDLYKRVRVGTRVVVLN